ncbi:MAG: heavy metal-associated domain-containing protein, partial [Syntrophaceae bacterium]|nr:heavy metal-associated domain-containing protein [Syntrophaceae bacterium]
MAKASLQIKGMSCAACVRRVENGLTSVEGIGQASVNFVTQKATLDYDPEAVSIEDIKNKIDELGYEVIS